MRTGLQEEAAVGEIDRREFLKRSALASAALGLMPLSAAAEAAPRRVTLGRTGLSVTDIGSGSRRIRCR